MAKKKQLTRLSESEWMVLTALWRLGRPATVHEVIEEMNLAEARDYRTIQTWLIRIRDKGWLSQDASGGRPLLYRPEVPMEEGIRLRTGQFLEAFRGDPKELRIVRKVVQETLRSVAGRASSKA